MGNREAPAPKQQEVISERTDEAAEENFIKEFQVNALSDQLVSTFDKGISVLSDDKEFKVAFKKALDTLVQNTVSRLVNVNDLSTMPLEKKALIHLEVVAKLLKFKTTLEQQVGFRRDVSDVEDTKQLFLADFSYKEFLPQASYGVIEGRNNATVSVTLKGTVEKPRSLDFRYREPGGETVKMSIKNNEEFYATPGKTAPGSLADKVRRNRDIYLLPGVNYRIEDPAGFQRFLGGQLKSLGLDAKSLTEKSGLEAAVDIVKANLKTPKGNEYEEIMAKEDHPSNTTPIDQLLIGKGVGVCRHFAAASRVVFEEIQDMAAKEKNDKLKDTVVFENYMEHMAHGTLGIARGNSVTTMDSFWYAQGVQTKKDSTFDGKHGNVTALYQTLSRAPDGRPEDRIFDLGNSSQIPTALINVFGDEALSKLDSREQSVLAMANSVLENPGLQSAKNILGASNNLAKITREILQKNKASELNQVLLHGVKQVSKGLSKLVDARLKDPDSERDMQDLLLSRAYLQLCLRRASGGDVLGSADEAAGMDESVKQKYNLERAAALYYEAKSKADEAIQVGHIRYAMDTDLGLNEPFKKSYLDPAVGAAKAFVDFMMKERVEDRQAVSQTVKLYTEGLSAKVLSKAKGLGKVAAETVLPIFESVKEPGAAA